MAKDKTRMEQKNSLLSVTGKIIGIIITYFIVGGFFYIVGAVIGGIPPEEWGENSQRTGGQELILGAANLFTILLVVFLFRRIADNKSIKSLGFSFRNRWADLFWGFVVSALILCIGGLYLFSKNQIEIAGISFDYSLFGINFIVLLFVALGEEILFRGYILNNLLDSTNKYLALFISSVLFSAMHLFNSHISFLAILNLFLAGVLLGSLYIYTRNLWFAISQHLFWNFIQGPVMGFNVSGHKRESVLSLHYITKNSINGGDFGFEGSVICTILSLLFIAVIMSFQTRKNKKKQFFKIV